MNATNDRHTRLHVITNSELEAWRKCHAFWGFRYPDLLRTKEPALPLTYGTLHHCGAEAGWLAAWSSLELSRGDRLARARAEAPKAIHAKALQYFEELNSTTFPEHVDTNLLAEETEQARDVALWSVDHYFTQAQTDLDFVPLLIEAPYTVQIPTKAGVGGILGNGGVIDLVLWDREQGRILIQDHKGTKSAVQSLERRVELDTQLTGYLVALRVLLRELGDRFKVEDMKTTAAVRALVAQNISELMQATTGTVGFNVVRRARPNTPKLNLLKKGQVVTSDQKELFALQETDGEPRGEVSVAEIDTLPEVYAEALQVQFYERELVITDKQRERLDKLKAKGDTYFSQIEFFRGADAIERWRQEVWIDARRMREATRDHTLRTRNALACTLPSSPACPYAAVCLNPDSAEARAGFRIAETAHEELVKHEQESGDEEAGVGF